jgi:hypothetical protein
MQEPGKYDVMLAREKKTVGFMLGIYCKQQHHNAGNQLCSDCMQIKEQIFVHLKNCPSQEKKTACGRCGLKCYAPGAKMKVTAVMNYSGPRMLFYHPSLALHHLWDARRAPPKLETKITTK